MKIEIKVKNGPFGIWRTDKVANVGRERPYQHLADTPAKYVWELGLALNHGLTVYEAESVHARAGRLNAPIYRIDVINRQGKRVM